MDKFTEIITYFALLSVAAERLTDIFKKAWLSKLEINPAVYQVISGLFGAGLAYSAPLVIPSVNMPLWGTILITGLAVSGGSSFWNTILSTMTELKTKVKANNEQAAAESKK